MKAISKRRLRLPGCGMFQRAFTTDMPDLGKVVGPIDLFDGLDAIMLSTFSCKEFRGMEQRSLHVGRMEDCGSYPHRIDPRIVPRIEGADMPLVTLSSALLSVRVLSEMYRADEAQKESGYAHSLYALDKKIEEWASLQ